MKLIPTALTMATCLVATAVLVPVAAVATADAGPPGARILSGALTRTDGGAFTRGTPVSLYVLDQPVTEGGDTLSTLVASTTVGEAGSFDLRSSDLEALSAHASSTGIIDFEVRAIDGDSFAPFSFSRTISRVGGTPALVEPGSDIDTAGDQRRAVTEAQTPVTISPVPGALEPDALPAVARVGSTRTDVCGETAVKNFGSQRVVVGATYAVGDRVLGTATYTTGASTAIGVGYSVSGNVGSYSQQGALSKTSTTTIDFGTRTGNFGYSTFYRFQKYSQWCYPASAGATAKKVYAYKVKADRFDGGSYVRPTTTPKTTHCADFAASTTLTKTTSASSSWTNGVVVGDIIGISMSTRTGFSTKAKLTYRNSNSSRRHICGTNGPWASTPGHGVAKL